jgi:predicted HicB family RNase H-like nuclease
MDLQITSVFSLTDGTPDGTAVLRAFGDPSKDFGPVDIVRIRDYDDAEPARVAVRRAVDRMRLTKAQKTLVASFCGPGRPTTAPATSHLHIRIPADAKARFSKAAAATGTGLSDWVLSVCEKAAKRVRP